MITSYEVFVPTLMGAGSSYRTGLKAREMGCKKAFVVYDKGLKDLGIADMIVNSLQEAGVDTVEFSDVIPDPPDEMMEHGAELAKAAGVDLIVAVGGGSAIDTAKGINVLINNPAPIRQYFGVFNDLNPGLKLIFIPTTSGTGSEVTNMSVVTCVSENKKASVVSKVCVADLAIVDPELTVGMPPKLTAATGVDAFAHAVESMTGGQANPIADALASEAIRMIVKWLPVAIEDGKNLEARENMILASTYAGMAFTNALVHMGHSIGHSYGALFHIPHGVACSLVLPEVIEFTAKTEGKKVRMICECMGLDVPDNATDEEAGVIVREGIRAFLRKVGMPNPAELGVPEEALPKIAVMIANDSGMAICPYRVGLEGITSMLRHAHSA